MKRTGPPKRRTQLRRGAPLKRGEPIARGPGPKRSAPVRRKCGGKSAKSGGKPATHRQSWRESERWRRYVASMPCAHCGLVGRSQAAHVRTSDTDGGMGRKPADCYVIPLCADEPGRAGCHSVMDGRAPGDLNADQGWAYLCELLLRELPELRACPVLPGPASLMDAITRKL